MFWSWFDNTLQIVVLIHLVPKVLEPNIAGMGFTTPSFVVLKCENIVCGMLECLKKLFDLCLTK